MAGYIHSHIFKGATGAALTALPAADAEIQPYLNAQTAKLLRMQANVSVVTLATIMELSITQEPGYANQQNKINAQNDGVVATGDPSVQASYPIGKIVARDMDLTSTPGGPGSDTSALCVDVLYGQRVPVPQGKFIDYLVTGTGDDSTSFTAFAGGTVNDLDPSKAYGLRGITPIIQDQAGIAQRIRCPSFDGVYPAALYANGGVPKFFMDEFGNPILAGTFTGAETITVESASHVAQTPDCILHLVEIGNIAAAPGPVGVGRQTGGSGSATSGRRSVPPRRSTAGMRL